jgi:hypothetical protein
MVLLSGSLSSSGSGLGVDTHGDVALASLSSTSRTNLAATLDPGPRPVNEDGCFYTGCGGLIALSAIVAFAAKDDPAVDAAVLAIGGVLLMVGWNKRSTKAAKMPERIAAWQKKVDLQERGWICHRCGHTWIPE